MAADVLLNIEDVTKLAAPSSTSVFYAIRRVHEGGSLHS